MPQCCVVPPAGTPGTAMLAALEGKKPPPTHLCGQGVQLPQKERSQGILGTGGHRVVRKFSES